MTAIQDKTIHAEITDMLNSAKGKEAVMETLFNEITRIDLEVEWYIHKDSVRISANWEKLDLLSKKAREYLNSKPPIWHLVFDMLKNTVHGKTWIWLHSMTKFISFREFEELLLNIK